MKRTFGAIGIAVALLGGCAGGRGPAATDADLAAARENGSRSGSSRRSAPAPRGAGASSDAPAAHAQEEVVARIGGRNITLRQLREPLVEAHGLTVLLNVVQLELARQKADAAGVAVTEADFGAERERTMGRMFKEADEKAREKIDAAVRKKDAAEAERLRAEMKRDLEQMFEQFLANQKVSRPEFDLLLRTNTYLRKAVEPSLRGRITDEVLQKKFETEYGATVRVRHIQASSPREIGEAQRRLAEGQPFEEVATAVSRNKRTASLGGELPRFSLSTTGLPENFKRAAFDLKEGEVSNMVQADGGYHLIKLEKKFAPKVVKFEDVKESLRAAVLDQTAEGLVMNLREDLAEQARKNLRIEEPVLREQFARRMREREQQIQEMNAAQLREDQESQRQRLANPPEGGEGEGEPGAGTDVAPETGPPTEPSAESGAAPGDEATSSPAPASEAAPAQATEPAPSDVTEPAPRSGK